ncbi:MAG TPA: cation diffusion facilitator family transporter [Thermoleophilaceae bacterium]
MSETNGTSAGRTSRRSVERTRRNTAASRRTVLVALASNVTVAAVKLFGGLASGSTAMLAEAAHSLADTANQAFLLVSIALGSRDPSPDQPFGYAQMRFLWTFVAAVGMFLAGAVFAIGYGVYELIKGEQASGFAIAYVTLAIAFAAEGASWLRALRQVRAEAREAGLPLLRYVRGSRDPNVKMVLFEDSAALIGIVIALAGILVDQLTGSAVFDPAASIAIGALLVAVAVWMGRDVSHLLIGRAARPEERDALERALREFAEVDQVVELLTMALGPNSLLVAARIDLADGLDPDRLEQVSDRIDERLREVVPDVTEVFLDPTRADSRAARAAVQRT